MDLHILPGVKALDVAEAHRRDMLIQNEHDCKCMTYWIDEKRGNVFCLIEAPDKESVEEMHTKAHGLIPHRIIEVNTTVVESFLGRISDPEDSVINEQGLKVFADPSFRIIMMINTDDPVLLRHSLGIDANRILDLLTNTIRIEISVHDGKEVEHGGNGFITSFTRAASAVECALAIQNVLEKKQIKVPGFKIAISAGEPVTGSEKIFGETIRLAELLCGVARDNQIIVSQAVRDLVAKDHFQEKSKSMLMLAPQDENLLWVLFNTLEKHWQDADFNVAGCCHEMAMSKSQLYRKTIALSGYSPNSLLKEFRLEKARDMMKKQSANVSQITFDSGFTSPSYFTKCFKKKFGLLPMSYLELLR